MKKKREIFGDLEEIKQVTSLSPCKNAIFKKAARGEEPYKTYIYLEL